MKIPGLNNHIYLNHLSGAPRTRTPELETVSNPETVAQTSRATRAEWARKASVRERARLPWTKMLGVTITDNAANPFRDPPDTGHFIQGLPYKLSDTTPDDVRTYIEATLCNLNHESLAQLHNRAQAFLTHRAAERRILDRTDRALKDPSGTSKALQQSAWMIHVQRKAFAHLSTYTNETARATMEGRYLHYASAGPHPWKGKAIARVSATAALPMSMLVSGQEGPLTLEQSACGAEIALAVHLITREVEEVLSRHAVLGYQVKAKREPDLVANDARPSHVRHGLNLSPDHATKIHEELGLPIRTGPSGSASFMGLSHYHACKSLDVPQHPEDVDAAEYRQIVIDLAFHYFCTGELPAHTARMINQHRAELGVPQKTVDDYFVQTHSYPEVSGPVEWGLQRRRPYGNDMRDAAQKAAEYLEENARDSQGQPQAE